jgi:hypothetical protein
VNATPPDVSVKNCKAVLSAQLVKVVQRVASSQLPARPASPSSMRCGAQVSRALSIEEWASHELRLRDDFGSTTTMTKDSDGWVIRSSGGGFSEIGDADCWTDKSPQATSHAELPACLQSF